MPSCNGEDNTAYIMIRSLRGDPASRVATPQSGGLTEGSASFLRPFTAPPNFIHFIPLLWLVLCSCRFRAMSPDQVLAC